MMMLVGSLLIMPLEETKVEKALQLHILPLSLPLTKQQCRPQHQHLTFNRTRSRPSQSLFSRPSNSQQNWELFYASCIDVFHAAIVFSASLLVLHALVELMRCVICQESTAGTPPGNRGLPLIGETVHFIAAINSSKGFYDFVDVRRLRYGSCFKTRIFGETHVFVASTESAKAVLNNDSGKNFSKRYIRSIGEVVGDQSLLCASPDHHKIIRGRLSNLFSTNSVAFMVHEFDHMTLQTLENWEDGGTVVVLEEVSKLTFKAICKMLMSLEGGDEMKQLQEDMNLVCKAMLALPLKFPGTRFYKGLQARKRIMSRLEKIMESRRSKQVYHDDFLQQLLEEHEETSTLTDTQIKDNILTMIIAGQDTTASAITWMIKYLDDNKDVQHMLREEQVGFAERASSPASSDHLTLDDLSEMKFAAKVVKESLRMASVVPWFPRLSLENSEIQGYKIEKGWNVNVAARSIHLDPTVYHDPNKFNPSRFSEDAKPYSFLAFGLGGRTCLGMTLAKAMMLVFLHRLVTSYKWEVVNSDTSVEKWALFSRLKCGCPVKLTRFTNKQ